MAALAPGEGRRLHPFERAEPVRAAGVCERRGVCNAGRRCGDAERLDAAGEQREDGTGLVEIRDRHDDEMAVERARRRRFGAIADDAEPRVEIGEDVDCGTLLRAPASALDEAPDACGLVE